MIIAIKDMDLILQEFVSKLLLIVEALLIAFSMMLVTTALNVSISTTSQTIFVNKLIHFARHTIAIMDAAYHASASSSSLMAAVSFDLHIFINFT